MFLLYTILQFLIYIITESKNTVCPRSLVSLYSVALFEKLLGFLNSAILCVQDVLSISIYSDSLLKKLLNFSNTTMLDVQEVLSTSI